MLLAVVVDPLKQQSVTIVALAAGSGFDIERAADFDWWCVFIMVAEPKALIV
jgi:hypothetical protein